MGRCVFLLNMKRVDNETMGFKFTVKPLDCHSVSSHGHLPEDMFTSSSEVSSIENDLVVL